MGLTFFSFMMGSISGMLKVTDKFEDLIDEKMQSLDFWIKKIERSNKPLHIQPDLYYNIQTFVSNAFLHDFNMIIEEFPFYQQISPSMQSELMDTIFKDFYTSFKHFFGLCERGFMNELIINMYFRIYPPDTMIVSHGQKFLELYFIRSGEIHLQNKFAKEFLVLPSNSFFGEYQILFELQSNIIFKTSSTLETRFMCVQKKILLNLCEMFPGTCAKLKLMGLERRRHFI